jgi:hypothetical protein
MGWDLFAEGVAAWRLCEQKPAQGLLMLRSLSATDGALTIISGHRQLKV